MIKILLLILTFYQLLLSNDFVNINLSKFADIVSKQNNINIIIDEDINKNISLLVPDKLGDKELFKMFEKTINKSNYNLKKYGNIYYLSKKLKYLDKSHLYKLKYNSFKDCEAVLSNFGVSYTYLKDLNGFMIKSTNNQYKKIETFLNKVDIQQSQVMLKIMIFEYSNDDIEERGIQYASIYKGIDGSLQYALNAIIAPLSTTNPTLLSSDFYAAVRLLNENKEINVKQNPFILAKNKKSFKFEAVENIPYLVTTTKTDAANTSEQNSIEYKDVGLKINGISFIHSDYITLDLDLIIEDLLPDNANNTMPETYKRVLKSNTNIEYNKVLLLSGIKRIKHIKNSWSIPFISNIPYLGELFKYKYNTDKEINITIAIEVIRNIPDSIDFYTEASDSS